MKWLLLTKAAPKFMQDKAVPPVKKNKKRTHHQCKHLIMMNSNTILLGDLKRLQYH